MTRWLIVVAALLAAIPTLAQTSIVPKDTSKPPAGKVLTEQTANYLLPNCEDQALQDFRRGWCVGVIYALVGVLIESKYICVPDGATESQARRVVVRYISARPERMHEPFLSLASEAIRDAWPCKPPG